MKNPDGQGKQDQEQQAQVEGGLPAHSQPFRRQVRIEISGQQRPLIKHHTGVPHRRAASQQGQGHLAEHGFDHEQQGGAEEHGEGEQDQQGYASSVLNVSILTRVWG